MTNPPALPATAGDIPDRVLAFYAGLAFNRHETAAGAAADIRRHDPFAWRLWSLSWTPRRTGRVRVTARATDCRGSVQPRDAVWNPSGLLHNGWHGVEIDVRE